MEWFVYLIECRDGTLYTGIAIDVDARFAAHVAGRGARYTRSHPPLRLVGAHRCFDRSQALRAEAAIKRLPRLEKRRIFEQAAGVPWVASFARDA